MEKVIQAYKALLAAREKVDAADEAWEADPNNKVLESAFDDAYRAEWSIREEIACMISDGSKGMIDRDTALRITFMPGFAELMEQYA